MRCQDLTPVLVFQSHPEQMIHQAAKNLRVLALGLLPRIVFGVHDHFVVALIFHQHTHLPDGDVGGSVGRIIGLRPAPSWTEDPHVQCVLRVWKYYFRNFPSLLLSRNSQFIVTVSFV